MVLHGHVIVGTESTDFLPASSWQFHLILAHSISCHNTNRPSSFTSEQATANDWHKNLRSMPPWRGRPNTRTLPTVLLTPPASKAAGMAHLCVPQNQAVEVCREFVPDVQVYSTHGREDLVNATITSNAKEEEEETAVGTFLSPLACCTIGSYQFCPSSSVLGPCGTHQHL